METNHLDNKTLYIIQGYHNEHVSYLQRAIFAEAENRRLKEQLHQEQINAASTTQGLNDEIANLQAKLVELQNGSFSDN